VGNSEEKPQLLTRITRQQRAGREISTSQEINPSNLNAKQQRALKKLSSPVLNADAVAILDEAYIQQQKFYEQVKNEEYVEDEENQDTADQSGRALATFGVERSIDQMYRDFALFKIDGIVVNMDPRAKN